ncbi:MAG: keto-deoxy-phosphogluconate aldolase [Hydrocarboniphaga sp.]|uniref:bifunctional 4-hydroxy-2-oxoglutarate aldolase/2-dehydro-3-deoxy-phosphogluconate aldolase n=1 Tax=Hydrocarboniphaga sp. TaxID=2033016 RepID=UPI00260B27CE|nr:bifunctional 4-hydroxy-2-oxoglutarate aldolase/2-dehydro-3-deoxy-phosphogluconate aldolase [Hydrocarboniphaga sp.]MDB5971799.1 keto-deoxy-phosphogluconate aldolase [Hydrocarboniphaga sp.]
MKIDDILALGPVIPVIVIKQLEHAVPLARALVGGGIRVLEVTLRTPAALAAIRAIGEQVPDAVVGVGTITRVQDLKDSLAAGAKFGVSPGVTPALLEAIRDSGMPFLPGAMTPSDVMLRRDAGFTAMKLFPAQQAGGIGMLKALGSVFADVRFCPTGGIDAATAPQFLALPNVACVGGSWLAPPDLVEQGRWSEITALAKAAVQLGVKTR